MSKIRITHFSDILCVWAYISEIRMDHLQANYGDRIDIEFRLFPVFGNVPGKMQAQWQQRGGIEGYSQHVAEVAKGFNHIKINPSIWQTSTPASSLPAHLHLSAVRLAEQHEAAPQGSFLKFKKLLRIAFFDELQNIAQHNNLLALAERAELPTKIIEQEIQTGNAFAALAEDMQMAKDLGINSSPTLIFNQDRQRLTGNVGYRIIEANVRELLEHPQDAQSWC